MRSKREKRYEVRHCRIARSLTKRQKRPWKTPFLTRKCPPDPPEEPPRRTNDPQDALGPRARDAHDPPPVTSRPR